MTYYIYKKISWVILLQIAAQIARQASLVNLKGTIDGNEGFILIINNIIIIIILSVLLLAMPFYLVISVDGFCIVFAAMVSEDSHSLFLSCQLFYS